MRKTVYKLVLFDMDETLLKGRTIHIIGRKKGFVDEVLRLEASDIISYKKNKMIAMLLKGLSERELLEMFQGIELQEYVPEVMDALRKKGVKTAIVTNCYQFLADALRQRLGMDYAVGNDLVMNNGVVTGELRIQNTFLEQVFEGCKIHPICKRSLVDWFSKKLKIAPEEIIAVGDGKIDICMLERAGLGVAYRASPEVQEHADVCTDDLRIILRHV